MKMAANMQPTAKFRADRSSRCPNMAVIPFFIMADVRQSWICSNHARVLKWVR